MLADPLDVLDAALNKPAGRLCVAVASLLIAGILWQVDRFTLKRQHRAIKSPTQRRSNTEVIRHYEILAIHGCLRLFSLAAIILALTYFGRAFFRR